MVQKPNDETIEIAHEIYIYIYGEQMNEEKNPVIAFSKFNRTEDK